jgi:5-methyltetrahydropteroyltriglutamate--homocysteine methyltransferase
VAVPEIKTTVVGSYPIPSWLATSSSRTALEDAVMVVFQTQELAGIDVVVDGELYRFDVNHPETNGMIDYFIGQMDGIDTEISRADWQAFQSQAGMGYRAMPAGVVNAGLGEGTLNLPKDFGFVQPLTDAPLKFTLTGPHMLAKVLVDNHYNYTPALAMAIAEILRKQVETIDADVIQIDEANVSGNPSEGPWAAEAINHVLDGAKGEKAVHVCFGNYGGQRVQDGLWDDLMPFLSALHTDHLVLEFARRGYEELPSLKNLPQEIGVGLGVIDIKDNEIETPDTIARRLENAVSTLGDGRVKYIHPDCGFWMLPRSVADGKMRALVAGRDRYLGI